MYIVGYIAAFGRAGGVGWNLAFFYLKSPSGS